MTSPTDHKTPSPLSESLPEYLGMGILDAHSVELGPDTLTARYTVDGDLLCRVSISDQHVQIEEFLDGKSLATTQSVSLQDAFFHHLMTQRPYDNRRYERLYHRLTDGRNVVVRYAGESAYLYYPAGYIFTLRQPVVSGNQAILARVARSATGGTDQTRLKLDKVRDGVVLRLLENGEVTAETVRVADFTAILLRVVEAADRLWQSGIVPPEKEYALAVMDSSLNAAGNLTVRLGDTARGIAAYSVVVTEGTDWTTEKLQNDFGAAAPPFLPITFIVPERFN
jgi:hypothetical protein